MAQGRRKKGSGVSSGSIGGRPGPRSVYEVSGYDRMAGASPSEQRRNQFSGSRRPKHLTGKVAGTDDPERFSEKYNERREKQRKSDLKRVREIKRRQKAQAQIEKGKRGKTGRGVADRAASTGQGRYSAVVGMGPAQITTGGGLGMLTQQDRSKPKKMNMGGVMRSRGGTFKGVF
jgi:hypothetical protein